MIKVLNTVITKEEVSTAPNTLTRIKSRISLKILLETAQSTERAHNHMLKWICVFVFYFVFFAFP